MEFEVKQDCLVEDNSVFLQLGAQNTGIGLGSDSENELTREFHLKQSRSLARKLWISLRFVVLCCQAIDELMALQLYIYIGFKLHILFHYSEN